jgi:hypothetical protein
MHVIATSSHAAFINNFAMDICPSLNCATVIYRSLVAATTTTRRTRRSTPKSRRLHRH